MRVPRTYRLNILPTAPCVDCGTQTIFVCMECSVYVCPMCQFSMAAMCRNCRSAYVGPVHQLGARADKYIREELDRLFE